MAKSSGSSRRKKVQDIITRMEKRFETGDGRGQAIRRFEGAQQQPEEVLGTYLFRLRQMAEYAFGIVVSETKRSRVLWRFIAGMNSDFIIDRESYVRIG